MKTVITRFAPSPTGFLHVGGLRTALYNYLVAKAHKGKFFLRIEDTDQSRKVEGAAEQLRETLKNCGITWDNEPPMVQSERLEKYQQAAEKLVAEKKAYHCFCTKERLEQLRSSQQLRGLPPMYDGHCQNLAEEEIEKLKNSDTPKVIRFKVSKTGHTEFIDLIRGRVSFSNSLMDDPIILKSDGYPTYHLASIVDDSEMGVTNVIRGEEWLPSTPKHVMLYQAFNLDVPEFAHLPLLLNPDKSKLSKRQGDVAVEDYLAKGYLPEALLNFVLLLGWNPGTNQEIFSLEEMITVFSLKKINKSGAVFDTQKLDWLNGKYIKKLTSQQLAKLCKPYFDKADIKVDVEMLEKIVVTEQERMKRLDEIVEATSFFFQLPEYESSLLNWKKNTNQETADYLQNISEQLEKIDDKNWNEKSIESEIKTYLEANNIGNGDALWPMRVALTGRKASPGPFEVANALGKTESISRIKKAISFLK
jgi:glutamyl-tRNA synthetase